MTLRINGSGSIIEGGMQEICVVLVSSPADHAEFHERDIPISLSVLPQSGTGGMCMYMFAISSTLCTCAVELLYLVCVCVHLLLR